jgi:hypothetical protein
MIFTCQILLPIAKAEDQTKLALEISMIGALIAEADGAI